MIKLLTKAKKDKLLKEIYEIERKDADDFASDDFPSFKDWDYDPYDWSRDMDLVGGLDGFPDCCGADVLCNFDNRESVSHDRQHELDVILNLDNLFRESKNKLLVAVLNSNQQKVYKDIFEMFGGERFGRAVTGHHGRKLYLWVFTKGKPRSKAKKVFRS